MGLRSYLSGVGVIEYIAGGMVAGLIKEIITSSRAVREKLPEMDEFVMSS